MTSPVTAEQVCDVDTWTVQVTLDPDWIIDALVETLKGHTAAMLLVRHLPTDHPEHIRARAELVTLLSDTFAVTLSPRQAEALEGDLYAYSTEPDRCHYCESFSVVKIEGVEMCHVHAAAADRAAEASAS